MSSNFLKAINKTILLAIAFNASNCNNEKFRSSGNAVKRVSKIINIGCNSSATAVDSGNAKQTNSSEITGLSGSQVKVKGEFCSLDLAPAVAPTDILFIIDFSGSMKDADPASFIGGCGRLKAAQDYVADIEKQIAGGKTGEVNFGVISFDSAAATKVNLTKLADFKASLTNANFCGENGSTNYEDAFEQASILLAPRQSSKVIYFISDGQPAGYGISPNGPFVSVKLEDQAIPIQKGREAAQRLKEKVTGLSIFAIFLNKSTTPNNSFDPNTYLAEITGDPSRVAVVTNADQLATKIVTFAPPKPLSVEESSVVSTLSAEGFSPKKVEMEYFRKDPTRNNFYVFQTKDVELFGKKDQFVVNLLKIKATSADGTVPEVNAEIKFQQK